MLIGKACKCKKLISCTKIKHFQFNYLSLICSSKGVKFMLFVTTVSKKNSKWSFVVAPSWALAAAFNVWHGLKDQKS
jgi:penicillin-binding protein-related factor A (putative recombinase)